MDLSLKKGPIPKWAIIHGDFIVAKPIDIELIYRHQMKDMFMIFLMIPHNQVWVEWFGHSALSK